MYPSGMRTTVCLDDTLLHEVWCLAAEERKTLTAVIEEALREMLARRKQQRDRPRTPLPTYPGWGLRPGIDLDNTAAVLDWLDEVDAPQLRGTGASLPACVAKRTRAAT
jgi:hypothetical protein